MPKLCSKILGNFFGAFVRLNIDIKADSAMTATWGLRLLRMMIKTRHRSIFERQASLAVLVNRPPHSLG